MSSMKINKKKIEHEIKRLGWNYSRLAKEGGISRQLINYYLHSEPSIKIVEKLAMILNVDPRDLLV